MPVLVRHLSAAQLALILAGGLAYTVGMVVLWRRWPDPRPRRFGFVTCALVSAAGTVSRLNVGVRRPLTAVAGILGRSPLSQPACVMDGSPVLEGYAPYDTLPDQPRHHFGHPRVENQRAGTESTLRGTDPIATRSRPLAINMVHLEYVNDNS